MRSILSVLSIVGLLALTGCPEPNLGAVPFLCNPGQPQCPEGYVCVKPGGGAKEVCVKEGNNPPVLDASVDAPPPDATVSIDWPQLPDRKRPPDQSTVKWDGQLKPDTKKVIDGWPAHLGCQSNTECVTDNPASPCCCPLLAGIWACLPICLNPICF